MVHVQMREEEVVDGQNVAEGQFGEAPFTAIEQQPREGLPAIDRDEQGVVASGGAEDAIVQGHFGPERLRKIESSRRHE
jgi:hypothetical protein